MLMAELLSSPGVSDDLVLLFCGPDFLRSIDEALIVFRLGVSLIALEGILVPGVLRFRREKVHPPLEGLGF
jgi:hypothetical protein